MVKLVGEAIVQFSMHMLALPSHKLSCKSCLRMYVCTAVHVKCAIVTFDTYVKPLILMVLFVIYMQHSMSRTTAGMYVI